MAEKYLIVDFQEVFFTALAERFSELHPCEVTARYNTDRGGVQFETQRYWIPLDSPLATECLLREIGRIETIPERTVR